MLTALQCRQIHCIFYVHYQIETFSATPPGGVQQKQKKGGKLQISSTGSRFNGLSEVRKV